MLKVFSFDKECQAYQDLLETKDKAREAISIKSDKFATQLKAYDCQLAEFMETLDYTMFNDWISAWEDRSTTSVFNDKTWTIIKGYFWIYLKDKLKKKIKEDERIIELKIQRKWEEQDMRQKALKEFIKQAELNWERNRKIEAKFEKLKEALLIEIEENKAKYKKE